jgi:hypothetical protein
VTITANRVLILAAVVVWVLVAFGVTLGSLDEVEETAVGLALFGAAALV